MASRADCRNVIGVHVAPTIDEVEPAVDHVRLNEYHRHRKLIAAGYDAAKAALPGLREEAASAHP